MLGSISDATVRSLVIGLVVISVVSFGAGVMTESVELQQDTPVLTPGDETGPGGEMNQTGGIGGDGEDGEGSGVADMRLTQCIDFLNSLPGTIAYFGAALLALFVANRRFSSGTTLLAGFGLAPFVLAGYFLNTDCVDPTGEPDRAVFPTPDPGADLISIPEVSPVVLVAFVGVILVGAAVVILRATGDQGALIDEDVPEEHETDVRDLARAAKAAADRLEKHNVDVDNAVYRAWWEMTRLLDVPNPKSATPREFADAAVEVGMSGEHVDELTTLFEEVRYGQRDAAAREEHAIEVFRTIEEEYGDDLGDPFDEDEDDEGRDAA